MWDRLIVLASICLLCGACATTYGDNSDASVNTNINPVTTIGPNPSKSGTSNPSGSGPSTSKCPPGQSPQNGVCK
jgi:hypothetical protein